MRSTNRLVQYRLGRKARGYGPRRAEADSERAFCRLYALLVDLKDTFGFNVKFDMFPPINNA